MARTTANLRAAAFVESAQVDLANALTLLLALAQVGHPYQRHTRRAATVASTAKLRAAIRKLERAASAIEVKR
jgi:hypothetical protein